MVAVVAVVNMGAVVNVEAVVHVVAGVHTMWVIIDVVVSICHVAAAAVAHRWCSARGASWLAYVECRRHMLCALAVSHSDSHAGCRAIAAAPSSEVWR